jgi:hypothetical protein
MSNSRSKAPQGSSGIKTAVFFAVGASCATASSRFEGSRRDGCVAANREGEGSIGEGS